MFGNKRSEAEDAINQLSDKLYTDIYNKVAKKLIEETTKNQKEINDQLVKRLDNWDIMVDEAIKKKVEDEWKLINDKSNN